jgi:hypothetical protein
MVSHFLSQVVERDLPQWRLEYESAMKEADHKALFKRIEVAEAAILTRREMLTLGPEDFAEWQEIERALGKLRHLKKEVLKFL